MTGTRRSRLTDPRLLPRSVLRSATALAVLATLVVIGGSLPSFDPLRVDGVVSVAVGVCLMCYAVAGLVTLRERGVKLLLAAAVALPLAGLFTWLDVAAAADLCKIVGAAFVGFWLAAQITDIGIIVLVAVLIVGIDIYSVFAGPTKAIIAHAPATLGYLTVAFPVAGFDIHDAYMLGVSDVIFYALFTAAAAAFHLRQKPTAVVMAISFVATVAATLWWQALPALPLLSVAFLGVNADLIRAQLSGRSRHPGP